MTPLVSVVIPCFNQGQFIDDAVDSVLNQTYQDFEIYIINDGSTNENTIAKLHNYNKPKTKVIHTENNGLASARNTGIRASSGKYILPLDADDKISPIYLEKAIEILEKHQEVKIVFGNAEFFGDKKEKLELWYFRDDILDYDVKYFLTSNFIYCSSVFRRNDYDKTKGYNINMKYGWEDWDFWLSLLENGGIAYKLLDLCFYYRYRSNSMVRSITPEQKQYLYTQLYLNHQNLYNQYFGNPISLYLENIELKRQLDLIRNSKFYKLINIRKKLKL
jgi:glycosyltransferase involved in cell wall biosynthesis